MHKAEATQMFFVCFFNVRPSPKLVPNDMHPKLPFPDLTGHCSGELMQVGGFSALRECLT